MVPNSGGTVPVQGGRRGSAGDGRVVCHHLIWRFVPLGNILVSMLMERRWCRAAASTPGDQILSLKVREFPFTHSLSSILATLRHLPGRRSCPSSTLNMLVKHLVLIFVYHFLARQKLVRCKGEENNNSNRFWDIWRCHLEGHEEEGKSPTSHWV